MSTREQLDALAGGECLVWALGSPGVAVNVGEHPLAEDAYQAFLDLHPQAPGVVLLMAQHAGWVRRAVVNPPGTRVGNLHAAHTASLRGSFKRRDAYALAHPERFA